MDWVEGILSSDFNNLDDARRDLLRPLEKSAGHLLFSPFVGYQRNPQETKTMNTAFTKDYPSYASFFRRWGAVFLDAMILIIPGIVLGKVFPFVGGVLIWLLYAPFLESSSLRATLGKKLLGIQVVDLQGNTLSFRAAMIRSLMKLVSSVFLCLPHLLALLTDRKQALHDIVAESVVIYGRGEGSVVDAWVNSFQSVFRIPNETMKSPDSLSALERLQALHERGALTKEEFEAEKRKILGA